MKDSVYLLTNLCIFPSEGPGFCYSDKLGEFKENEEKQIKEYCGIATCGKERIITYAR